MSYRGGGGGGDRRGYGGRDPRERSPDRRDSRGYGRGDRGYGDYGSRDRGGGRGRDRGGGGRGDGGARYDRQHSTSSRGGSTTSSISSLPSNVAVPRAGDRLPNTAHTPESKFTRGTVLTNHFRVQSLPVVEVYAYELRFTIPPDSIRPNGKNEVTVEMKRKIFEDCAEQVSMGSAFIFDGVSNGWSTQLVLGEGRDEGSKLIDLPGHSQERPNQVQVTVRSAGKVDVASIVRNFTEGWRDLEGQMVWLNALFRDAPAKRFMTKPRGLQYYAREPGLFQPLASTNNVLEAIRGFHQSVSTHFGLLSINVDTSCTAYYAPDMPVVDVMKAFGDFRDPRNPRGVDFGEVSEHMKGLVIYVTHRGDVGMRKRVKVKGLTPRSARQTEFEKTDRTTGESTRVTIARYFEDQYNIRLQFPDLPLLDTAIGFLPPELCKTAPGERYKEVLEGKETADFIKFATAPAFVRSKQIMESVGRLGWHDQSKLADHGVSVEPKMLEVPAARCQIPAPVYANNNRASIQNGSWNLRDKRFIKPSGFQGWGFVYFPPINRQQVPPQEIEGFMRTMYDALRQYGLAIPNKAPSMLLGNVRGDVQKIIEDIVSKARRDSGAKNVLIFCFVHEGISADFYKTIKTASEVEIGVPCQVLKIEKSVRGRSAAQYCANVAMKVNLKIGGANAEVQEPLLNEAPVMMIGADINHPSPAQLKSNMPPPSIFALSASNDMYASRYTAVAAAIPATQETLSGADVPVVFARMVAELVTRFGAKNGKTMPQRVVYWRDGVSESQEHMVLNGEVAAMKRQFEDMGLNITLTAILAVKRHHTRFFPTNRNDGDQKLGNVLPGTIVESGPKAAFVVGHGALQGTVRPTHYKIIYDENHINTDAFHRLILHGCYSYGKATRGVHTHAAIYYADQIAERSRARLRIVGDAAHFKDVHPDLRENTMWWQ